MFTDTYSRSPMQRKHSPRITDSFPTGGAWSSSLSFVSAVVTASFSQPKITWDKDGCGVYTFTSRVAPQRRHGLRVSILNRGLVVLVSLM